MALLAWFLLLFGLSSISKVPSTVDGFMISDKIAHAVYFAGGATALFFALKLGRWRGLSAHSVLICCVLGAAAVGAFDEWHQTFTPGRSGNDLGDWIADVIGGVLGFLCGALALRVLGNRPSCPSASAG